jgi:hypothetical protein
MFGSSHAEYSPKRQEIRGSVSHFEVGGAKRHENREPLGRDVADNQSEDIPVCKDRAKVEQRLGFWLASGFSLSRRSAKV